MEPPPKARRWPKTGTRKADLKKALAEFEPLRVRWGDLGKYLTVDKDDVSPKEGPRIAKGIEEAGVGAGFKLMSSEFLPRREGNGYIAAHFELKDWMDRKGYPREEELVRLGKEDDDAWAKEQEAKGKSEGKRSGMERLKAALSEARGPKLDTSGVSLSKEERPIDYGDCGTYLEVKYGKEKGQKYYEDMIDKPGSEKGLHFVVVSKIAKEIKKMLMDLGEYSPGMDLREVNYEGLKARWVAKAGKA